VLPVYSRGRLWEKPTNLYQQTFINTGLVMFSAERNFSRMIKQRRYTCMGRQINTKCKPLLPFLLFLFLLACVAGCGREEEDNGYYIIEMETEELFAQAKSGADVFKLGSQFYQGEPVQLAGYKARDPETGEKYVDVSLCHTSGEEEILWERVPEEYGYGSWYLDRDGNGYCFYTDQVIRYDKEGGERYRKTCEGVMRFAGSCMPDKGNILLLGQTQEGMLNLLELNADTGEISRTGVTLDTESVGLSGKTAIAGNGKGFLVLDSNGIWEADMEKGRKDCILSFAGGTYTPSAVSDFRILQDGTAEILCGSMLQTVRSVDISKERKVLVLRISGKISDEANILISGWLPGGIARFNKENGEYYVVVDERPEEEDAISFQERTDMELVLGKGPDMVLAMLNDPLSLVEKGALEDMALYMEASSIREEDYFPATFEGLRGDGAQGEGTGIYGINIMLFPDAGNWVVQELFPEGMDPDLDAEGLISALEAYEGDAVYTRTSVGPLYDLLSASDSLCGMVDWENGTCDFTSGKFKRILEVCKRYASREGDGLTVLSGTISDSIYIYANIYGDEDEMAARGKLVLEHLFDDGRYAGIDVRNRMYVSSASHDKEGVWEFIRFLLSEEEQSRISWVDNTFIYPSNRKAFETLAAKEIAEGSPCVDVTRVDGTTYKRSLMGNFWTDVPGTFDDRQKYYALTEEKVDRVRKMLEEAHVYPLRTEPVRIIIAEEAAAYFAGDRSVDDVCVNVQNRVQLYLSEHQ